METVILVIHIMIVIALIAVVLLQRSEGGALGIGGGGGGGNFMSARGAANALTRTTAILAVAFFATSITLGVLSGVEGGRGSIFDQLPVQQNEDGTGNGIFDQLPSANDGQEDSPEIPTSE